MSEPRTDYFVAGGTLHSEAPSYVERPADSEIEQLALDGRLGYVLTTRQMGKSSLMTRTAHKLRQQQVHTAIIDLTAIGSANVTIDEWYVSLLDDLQWQLQLSTDVETWWFEHGSLSPVRRFSKFMRELLPQDISGNCVIFIDEVDSALNLPFSDDFFAAVRALFNTATTSSQLSIILLGVAQPNDLIKDVQRTPFNVGRRLRLEELQLEQARPILMQGLEHVGNGVIDRIFYWTDGHPYLTQKIALAIARSEKIGFETADVDRLVETLFMSEQGRTEDSNVQFAAGRVTSSKNREPLLKLYRQILRGKMVVNDEGSDLQNELKLYGLVKPDSIDNLVVRNRIYATAFDDAWVAEQLPARNRAMVWAGLIALVLIFGLIGWNLLQQQQSQADLVALNVTQFEESTDGVGRLNSIGRIIELDEIETAVELFNRLPVAEQIALFEQAGAEQGDTVLKLTQLVYSNLAIFDLTQPAPSTALLDAMAQSVVRVSPAEGETLAIEIENWVRARSNALTGNGEQARIEYSVALALNRLNPATRTERALTQLGLGAMSAAVEDLDWLAENGHEASAARLIKGSAELQAFLRTNNQLVSILPTATETPIEVDTATVVLVQPTSNAGQDATASATPILPTQTAGNNPEPTADTNQLDIVSSTLPYELTEPFGTIVYTCFVEGVDQICTISADGSNRQQLTFSAGTDWYPSIASSGEIFFSSLSGATFGLYQIPAGNTSDPTLITPPISGDYAPELSPDGREIVFTRFDGGDQNIWLIDADGANARPLVDLDGDVLDPTWSPGGERVAFARLSADGFYTHYLANRDGSGLRPVTEGIEHGGGRSSWSPDGRWLAFYAGERGKHNVYVVEVSEGAGNTNLVYQLTEQGDNLAPAWSPDGNWLVFTSYRDGDNELYIMRPDGSDVRQVTVNGSADWQPRWGK